MADRRKNNLTEESANSEASITDSLGTFNATSKLSIFSDDELIKSSPEVILRRMLSTRSAISTSSSLAEANQRARDDAAQQHFISLGKGQCGEVFGLKGTTMVIKLPNSAKKEDELLTDYQTHKEVRNAFEALASIHDDIHVPRLHMWVQPKSAHFWDTKASLFPQSVETPNYGLISERIFPLPLPVREAIVDALCPKAIKNTKAEFLNQTKNKNCLIRLYLGRRTDSRKIEPRNVRLRNFPLHIDDMERLGLDPSFYAIVMAKALASLHWKAGVDANDVEFVLGSTPQVTGKPTQEDALAANKDSAADPLSPDFEHRTISIWLLDFNQCKPFGQTVAGMKQLVDGFWFNDPYYPRPNATNKVDQKLWTLFATNYLKVSQHLNNGPGPAMFINGVTEKGKARSGSMFG